MEYLVQFQLNIYALIILAILYVAIIVRFQVNHIEKKLIEGVILFLGLAIIVEPLTWIFDGTSFFGAYFLEYSTNFILLLFAPIIAGLMLSYVDYYIFKDSKRLSKRYYYLWPALLLFILLVINIFYPIFFSIDKATNVYKVENLIWIQYLMIVLYYLYMIVFSLINRKKTFRHAIVIFFVFFSLPLFGMVIQLAFSDFFFSWTSIVLGVLVIYIFLESTSGERDYLTKLYSRQSYEKYVLHLIDREKPFSILFIDLDNLKGINDKLGHFRGDQVLVEFGRTLIKTFKPNPMVSRLAGDEFTVVVENETDLDSAITEVYKILESYNDEAIKTLQFSYGYQAYEEKMTVDELYVKADKKMYIKKEEHRTKYSK